MRNLVGVVFSLVLWITASAASDKILSQWKCDGQPADTHSIPVGDHDGHAYVVSQGKCTPEKGATMGDAKDQSGTWTEFGDVSGGAVQNHGVFVVTLSSGDKVFYHYHGTQALKDGKIESGTNTWTLGGGTGKFEKVKGEGGCQGKGNSDGSSSWSCDGTYSAGK